jgi:hypothetical protein
MKPFTRILVLAVASCIISSFTSAAYAAPNSPAGDWDFVIGGKQRGLALMTFFGDYTLTGVQIIRPAPLASSSSSVDLRTGGRVASRDGSVSSSVSSNISLTTIVGGDHLTGNWTYDASGKVIGIIGEVHVVLTNATVSFTNIVNGTNVITSSNVLMSVEVTNGTSFRAVVGMPGTSKARMTLIAYNDRGTSTYKGVSQAVSLPDLTGDYSAFGQKPGRPYVEFFTFQPDLAFPNSYSFTNGIGPAYVFHGRAILSKQRQLALYTWTDNDPLNPVVTSYSGPFNATLRTGRLKGSDTAGLTATYSISPRP